MPVPTTAAKTPARAPAAAGRASRLAKIGEQIQMYSLNGSPITGFIGPDGRLRYLPRPGADYADQDQDEDAVAADAAPALPPISKPADGKSSADNGAKSLQAASALASILPKQGEASSSRALPSSPAPQRSAPFGSSLGGTSSLQPRFDDDTSAALQSNSSPLRPASRAGSHFSSSLGMGLGLADASNELPDEEAYMREIIAQEEQKRREAVGRSATLQHKSSASRLMAKFGAGGGGGGGGSGSSNGGVSSRPPSSPAPASSSYSARSGGGFRSSSPSKAAPVSRGTSLIKPASSSKTSTAGSASSKSAAAATSSASGRGGKQRLSLINARGEVVPIEDIREEDVPVEQKAQLARMFHRLGMGLGIGGSPKKR